MKNVFIFCLIFLSTNFVQAQKFRFGLTCGMDYHDWHYTGSQNSQLSGQAFDINFFKPTVGGDFGVTAKQVFGHGFSLNEEVLYAQRNVTYNGGLTYKNQYLAVPIYVSYNVYKPLSLDLGLEYSYLYKTNIFMRQAFFDDLNFLSGIVGIRYQFLKNFNIHGRYLPTFNKLSEVTLTDFNGNELSKVKLRSRTFSLSIGYDF